MTNKSVYLFLAACALIFCGYSSLLGQAGKKKPERVNVISGGEIVAFSLMKQIEIESQEFRCQNIFIKGPKRTIGAEKSGQWTKVDGTNIYIYSIYRDLRLFPHEYVRIIAVVEGSWNTTLFCQTSSSSGRYHITKALPTPIWAKSWNLNDTYSYYNPYLISCHVPLKTTPFPILLSTNPCRLGHQKFNPTTPQTQSNNFTICVKPLNFSEDISDRLLQWIAINRVLGAGRFHFYFATLHYKTLRVLKHLEENSNNSIFLHDHHSVSSEGIGHEITRVWQKRRYEIITYNDCLYRNLHSSQYIIPIDVDEIIVPRQVFTWAELLRPEGVDNFASFTVRNAYYLRQFNEKKSKEKVFFLKNVVRSELSPEGESGKSFVVTKNALTVFNHYALKTLKPGVGKIKFLNKGAAQMNHYRSGCDVAMLPQCAKYLSSLVRVVDDVIVKYKKSFYLEYKHVMKRVMHQNRF